MLYVGSFSIGVGSGAALSDADAVAPQMGETASAIGAVASVAPASAGGGAAVSPPSGWGVDGQGSLAAPSSFGGFGRGIFWSSIGDPLLASTGAAFDGSRTLTAVKDLASSIGWHYLREAHPSALVRADQFSCCASH